MPFKNRYDFDVRNTMQVDSLDNKTKNRFLVLFFDYVQITTISPYDAEDYGKYIAKFFGDEVFVGTTLSTIISQNFDYSFDDCRRSTILQTIIGLPDFFETYELLEIFVSSLEGNQKENFISDVNKILEEEKCNYRMSSKGELHKVDSKEDLKNIEDVQKIPLNSVHEHIQSALALYSDRENRNERNACQEAIHAIEALAKSYAGNKFKDKTFAPCLNEMLKNHPLPSFVEKTIRNIYLEVNSDQLGIRHALGEDQIEISDADAYFLLMTSIIFINYMQRKYPK